MLKAYLAGPVENKQDFGQSWRDKISPRLLELGIEPLDPTKNLASKRPQEWEDREQALIAAKTSKDWKQFSDIMHEIWVMNRHGVEQADFMIVHLKAGEASSGTIREMQTAYEFHKPIFLVVQGDARRVRSHTLYMALYRGQVFESFDQLFDHLRKTVKNQPEELTAHQVDFYQVSQKLLIVNSQNQLLVLKDAHSPYLDFPGGRIDIKEFEVDLKECLNRKIAEELGSEIKLEIDYRPIILDRDFLWDWTLKQPHYKKVFLIFYQAKYLSGKIQLSNEHESLRWVDIKTFDPKTEPFKPSDKRVVKEFLEQKRL